MGVVGTLAQTSEYRELLPSDWSDGVANECQTVAQGSFFRPTCSARLRFTATGPTVQIQIAAGSNLASPASNLAVKVDGAFVAPLSVVSAGSLSWVPLAIGAGSHSVEIIAGQQTQPGTPILGIWPVALRAAALTMTPNPSVAHRYVFIGDSLFRGNPTLPGQNDHIALLRAVLPATSSLAAESWGFRCVGSDQTTIPALVNRLSFDATTVDVILMDGTNDYGLNKESAAAFQTIYAQRLVDINAQLGSRLNRIWACTMAPRGVESANGSGGTCPNYRTSITTAAGGKAYVTVEDGTSWGLNTATDYADAPALHFNDAGHVKVFTAVRAFLGL